MRADLMRAEWSGHYLDGESALRRSATVVVSKTGLDIRTEDGAIRRWPFSQIRQTQGFYVGEPVRLERGRDICEALIVPDVAFLSALREVAPDLTRRFHDPRRRGLRIALTIVAALAAIGLAAALYRWGIPTAAVVATKFVPVAWEESLGNEIFARLVPPTAHCADPERQQIIDEIVATLMRSRPGTPYRLQVSVADSPIVNAFALPGGHIVVLRGLLDVTETPEMLAGVLAHELEHVLQRHTTRAILQHASTGLLVGAIAGDVSGLVTFGLQGARLFGALHYSRRNEQEADEAGMQMLLAARVDPQGMIAFFERMMRTPSGEPSGAWRYLSSHPTTEERIGTLRSLAQRAPQPPIKLLPTYDWNEVKKICAAL